MQLFFSVSCIALVAGSFMEWNQQCLFTAAIITDHPFLVELPTLPDHTSTIQELLVNRARQFVQFPRDDCWLEFTGCQDLPLHPDRNTVAMTIFMRIQESLSSVTLLYNTNQLYIACNQNAATIMPSKQSFKLNSAITFILLHAAAKELFAFLQNEHGNGNVIKQALSLAALGQTVDPFIITLGKGVVVKRVGMNWKACIVVEHHKLVLFINTQIERIEFI